MAKPVAVITSDCSTIIPVTAAPYTVNLDGTSSTATGPATIASYQWYLDKPPESAAALSSDVSATPSFVMDVPGQYQARLIVTDSNAVASEGFTVRIDPATSPYKFTAPSTAYHITRMSQALTETVPPTSGAKNVADDERELFFVVEGLKSSVASYVTPTPTYTRYVTMAAGSVAADGSASLPYTPQSAADGGYDGPVQQAVAVLTALGVTNPAVPRTVVMYGGTYDEDVALTMYGPWSFIPQGFVQFNVANTFAAKADVAATTYPILSLGSESGAISLGALTLEQTYASSWGIYMKRVYVFGTATQVGTPASRAYLTLDEVTALSTWTLPDALISLVRASTFGTTSLYKIDKANGTKFGSITVAASGADSLYSCVFTSSPTFTGPAGSARFDATTLQAFWAQHGTFAGGAGNLDAPPSCWSRRQEDLSLTIIDTGVALTEFVTAHYMDTQVSAPSRLKLSAWVAIYLADAGHSCRVGMVVSPVGGTKYPVALHASPVVGPFEGVIRLDAEVVTTLTGAAGTLSYHYTVRGGTVADPLMVDDEGIGFYKSSVDLDPAILRPNVRVDALSGFTGGNAYALLRDFKLEFSGD